MMYLQKAKIDEINEMRKRESDNTSVLLSQNSIVLIDGVGTCNIEDLSALISELVFLKDAIEEKTGVIL